MSIQAAPNESPQEIDWSSASRSWIERLVHYGWGPILVGAMGMAATYPGRTHGLGMVTEPLLADLNLASANGRVVYASLILTRGLGQSALSVVSLTIVAKSFDGRRIGMAMAWYAILSVPFHLILIKGVGWALTDGKYDWRVIRACVGFALMAMSALAIVLNPRGLASPEKQEAIRSGFTLAEALATPAFWVFSLTISLWGMIYAGVALFNVDIFRERGFDEKLCFNVLALVTIVALISKLFFGWLVNYVSLSRLLVVCLLTTSIALIGLPLATQVWHAYVYGVAYILV